MEQFKPSIFFLIKYYYDDLGNSSGGFLHVVLDDGNIEHSTIHCCGQECEKNGDSFGVFLSSVLLLFSEEELEDMYYNNHWDMRK